MHRWLCLLLVILAAFAVPAGAQAENLIYNADFELVDEFGLPDFWSRDMWYVDDGISHLTVEEGGYGGGNCIAVFNVAENDARFVQSVAVEPDSYYRIRCMVKAEGVGDEAVGANISTANAFGYSNYAFDTHGQWVELSLTGRTGEKQTVLNVFARVGGYGSLNTGKAWFDDFEMVKLDSAPQGVEIFDFTELSASSKSSDAAASDEPARNTEAFLLTACIYGLAVVGFARKKRRGAALDNPGRDSRFYTAIMLGALALRLFLALAVRGHNTDISCFEAWSERILSVGIGNFYSADYFCDYPPGYMLMLLPIALIRSMFAIAYDSAAHVLLIKLMPIAFDLLGAHLIHRLAKKQLGARPALLLSAFYALNPAVFVDSAAWGQVDSGLTLFIVIIARGALAGKYLRSLAAFAAAVLIKPQALLFAPLGVVALAVNILNRDEKRAPAAPKWLPGRIARVLYPSKGKHGEWTGEVARQLIGIVGALLMMYLVALPFSIAESSGFFGALYSPIAKLTELYGTTLGGYPYITVNALNLYVLLGKNWAGIAQSGWLANLAWILFALSYVYAAAMYLLSRDRKKLLVCGATLIMLIFAFGPMMHERYVYPALMLLILAYAFEKDARLLISAVLLTVTLALNQILILQGGMTPANYGHLQSSEQWLNALLSLTNVLLALFTAWTCFQLCIQKKNMPLPEPKPMPVPEEGIAAKADAKLRLGRVDYLLMAGVMLIYSIVTFVNLGTTSAPQTSWTSSAPGESIVFDLGEVESFRMTYYGGICNSTFTVQLSNDGQTWTESYYAVYDQGEIFSWLYYVPCNSDLSEVYGTTLPTEDGSAYVTFASYQEKYPYQVARYIRIAAQLPGLILSEIGFLGEDGEVLPIAALTRSGSLAGYETDPGLLIDEQDTVPSVPSYYNSTYFDEIYHARTAYEHIHGLYSYEWTHPPLGKVLMMIGINLFGMTPFGWRFMGALIGVIMLPVLYLLVKQLTKRSSLSLIAMALFALDSMHFTQTRIATIDSYAVLFIMVMYLFMIRYNQMSWNRQPLWRTLIPLALSGVFMGIAWATKWIGIYASVGLALIFFYTLYLRIREYPHRNGHFFVNLALFAGLWGALFGAAFSIILIWAQSTESALLTLLPAAFGALTISKLIAASALCAALSAACGIALFIRTRKLTEYQQAFWRNMLFTISVCVAFFIVIPLVIYYFSYYWQLAYEGGLNLDRILRLQKSMLSYHAQLGSDPHYFRSPWYQWPVIAWPMWYYDGSAYVASGMTSSISCMGNPAVWWTGLIALIFIAIRLATMRRAPRNYLLVIIAFASQYLPWMLVPRSMFIYHYFASVPFIIIATVLMLGEVRKKWPKAFKPAAIALVTVALILFVMFYPLESGMPVSKAYAATLRWFNWVNYR